MTKPLARKTTADPLLGEVKLKKAIEDRETKKLKQILSSHIDELGLCDAILAPFIETIKRQSLLREKVKDAMVKLKLLQAEGKTFRATRTPTPCRLLDQDLLKKALGDDLDPYKSDGVRNSVKVVKKDGTV